MPNHSAIACPSAADEAEAFRFIIEFIHARCGIRLHNGKEALIKARLGKRMRHHGHAHLAEYCEFLKGHAGEEELTLVVDAMTTNFTHFLREEDHFKFLVQHAVPTVLSAGQKSFNIWSAACSSGEEPYSIAFYLSEHFPLAAGWDWQVTASDISTKVLHHARAGIYPEERLRYVQHDWVRKYCQKGIGDWAGHYRIKRALAERVSFHQINLLDNYNHAQSFAAILCRNVMIYFDRPAQERLVNHLCRFLIPGGFLLIGHSESLHGQNVPVRCLRPSVYQKNTR